MSSGRRRPGSHGAAVLLLVGVIFLGVGVLLYLDGGDDRRLVAQDLGDVPGSTTAAEPRPLAEDIPVLAAPVDPQRAAGVPGLAGGFETAPAVPTGQVATPQVTTGPVATPQIATGQVTTEPVGAAAPTPPPAAVPDSTAAEPSPVLTDPTFSVPAPRPAPLPLPAVEQPLAPQQPGLVSALYPLPAPVVAATPRSPLVPARLELPARSVVAPVDSVGTGPTGGMVVPEQVRSVGWWAPGVLPGGGAGSAVIAGHVDSRTEGLGVLSVLPQLTEGEPVLVADASGRTVAYRVAARREYRKHDLPVDVFRRDGPPQLVLITCGGVFDPAARSYESNIVVYAVPA